ncbi:hypothetical protein BE221DRAFT_145451 [Ostreococcus tauri]|uniref:Uncharacterized protein n=1 Tax=Ostreococcus tauri TaxID=70448 RepID=A0A1Y5IBR3_OSTTA|nr:hypothetical protein BE221DRAFT_145451 [Ostreococcus tauri]
MASLLGARLRVTAGSYARELPACVVFHDASERHPHHVLCDDGHHVWATIEMADDDDDDDDDERRGWMITRNSKGDDAEAEDVDAVEAEAEAEAEVEDAVKGGVKERVKERVDAAEAEDADAAAGADADADADADAARPTPKRLIESDEPLAKRLAH